jgi:uracil-DNA glycosylase family 4
VQIVHGEGNMNARLMLVGEAPTASDEREQRPFTGSSGKVIDECLSTAGVERGEVYVTNVVKVRPPEGNIHRLGELATSIDHFLPTLWKEIEEVNPNCILALGNTALRALTGHTGIQEYRGSILPNVHSGVPKVVASLHPASLFHSNDGEMRSYRDRTFIQFDFTRAVEESLTRELSAPDRNLLICHNSLDFIRFWERGVAKGKKVASDIETFQCIPMCTSFAFCNWEAMSVPLLNTWSPENPEGIPLHDLTIIWKMIVDAYNDPQYQLIGQNWKFDEGRLQEGLSIDAHNLWWDTSLAWHSIYSELPKKLAFMASILTREPYYKDELEEYSPKKDKLEKRLRYNAKDSAVTFEVYEKEYKILEELNLLDWFFDKQMPLHKFYYNMERRGIMTDAKVRKHLIKKYERYNRWINASLRQDLGYDLNVNSPKQVTTTLFGDLRCPVRKDTAEETLQMLMLNAVKDDRRRGIINNILKGRKSRKTLSTYVKSKLWPDGSGRTVVNICGTESGRTSTSKPKQPVTVEPMGFAFQTMTKHGEIGADLRKMFVPRPGKVFIGGDGGQAEARVTSLLARDERALALMDRKDFKRNKFKIKDDIHTLTTMLVTGAAFEAIDDELRQIGKKTRHAGNYGMGKRRLSLLAQISEWRAGQCLDAFHRENPMISAVFWEEIRQALQDNNKVLMSPHGRRRQFFDRWGDDLFKEAYAHIPQATVSDHTKYAMIRIETRAPWIEMLAEAHDGFLAEIPEDRIDEASLIITEEMETPIDFSQCSLPRGTLVIPCEIEVGLKNWKNMQKYTLRKAA